MAVAGLARTTVGLQPVAACSAGRDCPSRGCRDAPDRPPAHHRWRYHDSVEVVAASLIPAKLTWLRRRAGGHHGRLVSGPLCACRWLVFRQPPVAVRLSSKEPSRDRTAAFAVDQLSTVSPDVVLGDCSIAAALEQLRIEGLINGPLQVASQEAVSVGGEGDVIIPTHRPHAQHVKARRPHPVIADKAGCDRSDLRALDEDAHIADPRAGLLDSHAKNGQANRRCWLRTPYALCGCATRSHR